ncbi:shootin-1 isoform X3 [Oreochromis aureus]|uniref:shootin-1 isoform X3 n=1 Tax=Oreochromis aureus TaxID=47969 RepID=UPI00195413F1|nr:shootin-1 isoform X3 [Oreochromis aureus]
MISVLAHKHSEVINTRMFKRRAAQVTRKPTQPLCQALHEYEDLQRKQETTAMELTSSYHCCNIFVTVAHWKQSQQWSFSQFKRLEEERDEAMKKLSEFQQVSQMVIEEVSAIQENLEIERMCRESAEALASKLDRQNRSLKRKSMMLLSHISPETIADIDLNDEAEESEDLHASSQDCLSPQCCTSISVLQNKLEMTVKEKNQALSDLEAVREQLRATKEELLKEKHDNTVLIAETLRQKKLLGKYHRVSQLAVEEYETLHDTFNLERDLRTEAENYARAMVVEQKKLKRQSQILMQSSSPSQALQDALSQVTRLTEELETQRLEHQNQIKTMEDMLGNSETQRELMALRQTLELLEEEKKEYSNKCSKAELEVKDLRFTVEELQKKLQAATNPPPAPTPPPPPPPPPPALPSTTNPLSTLVSLIRKRRGIRTDIPLVEQDSAKTPEVDVRQQAVEEMMQRIKKGVQLRPVNQSPNRTRKQMEKLPSNSAIQELKGIMENFNRTVQQPKAASPTTTRDDELQRILLRRRDALDA